jgi:hypothetical protein
MNQYSYKQYCRETDAHREQCSALHCYERIAKAQARATKDILAIMLKLREAILDEAQERMVLHLADEKSPEDIIHDLVHEELWEVTNRIKEDAGL